MISTRHAVVLTTLFALASPPVGRRRRRPRHPSDDLGHSHSDRTRPHAARPTLAVEKAPESFKVRFETTKGDFV